MCHGKSETYIFKDRGIRLTTQIMIVETLVFLIILYGAETCRFMDYQKGI